MGGFRGHQSPLEGHIRDIAFDIDNTNRFIIAAPAALQFARVGADAAADRGKGVFPADELVGFPDLPGTGQSDIAGHIDMRRAALLTGWCVRCLCNGADRAALHAFAASDTDVLIDLGEEVRGLNGGNVAVLIGIEVPHHEEHGAVAGTAVTEKSDVFGIGHVRGHPMHASALIGHLDDIERFLDGYFAGQFFLAGPVAEMEFPVDAESYTALDGHALARIAGHASAVAAGAVVNDNGLRSVFDDLRDFLVGLNGTGMLFSDQCFHGNRPGHKGFLTGLHPDLAWQEIGLETELPRLGDEIGIAGARNEQHIDPAGIDAHRGIDGFCAFRGALIDQPLNDQIFQYVYCFLFRFYPQRSAITGTVSSFRLS